MRWTACFGVLLFALAGAGSASAATRRLALLVGHNTGSGERPPLRYAEEDAGKLAQVLIELGGVDKADLLLVQGKGLAEVGKALDRIKGMVSSSRTQAEDRVLVLFYYSGHSDGTAIELGRERLPFDQLKSWLAGTGADVRIAIVDSCKSGALVQKKGGRPGPSFQINLIDQLATTGEVLLTSSAADELALESEEIRGSYFTHHFVSGLRGAADESGDGRVTLAEAYEYSFNRTVTTTSATGVTPQHPRYDYQLSGQGELVVTELSRPSSAIEAPAGFERALVVHVKREQVIAELTSDKIRRVAVAPGEYAVRAWKGGKSMAGRFKVARDETRSIAWSELGTTAPAAIRQKGGTSGDEDEVPPAVADHLLSFADTMVVTKDGVIGPEPGYTVYQGRYRKEVTGREFYEIIGREDLAARYRKKDKIRSAFVTTGGVGILVLVAYGVSLTTSDDPTQGITIVIAGTAGSLLLLAIGAMINPNPVDVPEAHRLGDEYNQKLLREGGPSARKRPTLKPPQVAVTPFLTPEGRGGGVMAGVRF